MKDDERQHRAIIGRWAGSLQRNWNSEVAAGTKVPGACPMFEVIRAI